MESQGKVVKDISPDAVSKTMPALIAADSRCWYCTRYMLWLARGRPVQGPTSLTVPNMAAYLRMLD